MKKFTALLLSVLMLLSVFVACENETPATSSQPEQSQTSVDVSLGDESSDPYADISVPEYDDTDIDFSQRLFLFDKEDMYKRLYSMFVSGADASVLSAEAQNLLSLMKGWTYHGQPVGGASYDGKIYTAEDATYVCVTDIELKNAATKAIAGDVIFIPSGVTIDMADYYETESYDILFNKGVILASDRGINEGATLQFSNPSKYLIQCKADVVITGLNLSGVISISGEHDASVDDYGVVVSGKNVTVSNCEIASFSGAGVMIRTSGSALIDHCFIHHNELGVMAYANNTAVIRSAFFENEIDMTVDSNTVELHESNANLTAVTPAEPLVAQVQPDIASALFPVDSYEVYAILEDIAAGKTERVIEALSTHAGTTRYYEFLDQLTIEKDGNIYGIIDDGTPVGGGKGYTTIHTTGDYVVKTYDELADAIKNAKSGEIIYIPEGVKIDITGRMITVPNGVILASNRGYVNEDGTVSTGAMLYTTRRTKTAITMREDSTITGIVVAGPDTVRHMQHYYRGLSGGSYTTYYYMLLLTTGIKINESNVNVINCEISGFSEAGVSINDGATGVTVSHSYIHHNQRMGFGYGVVLYGDNTEATISRNLFNFDRHAIAADGKPGSGYIADNNIHMGTAIFHIFDAHGGTDRGDGTQIACEVVEMTNNVFLSDKIPYKKRGTPSEYSLFTKNIIIYPETYYPWRQMYGNNFTIEDNFWGLEQPAIPEYNFENGKTYSITMRNPVKVFKYEDQTFITSRGASLRYRYFLVFTPKGDGTYYISEYGNNLDDGSIYGYNEKVLIPEGGFVLTFTNAGTSYNLYKDIEATYEVIYNTSLPVYGDYMATVEGNNVTIIKGSAIE